MRALVLLLLCMCANAAPTLTAAPYPAGSPQPDAAQIAVTGPAVVAPITCTLPSVSGGLQPTCDLASITVPGDYTIIMTVSRGCSGGDTCAGAASSAPFVYHWLGRLASPSGLQLVP